MDQPFLAAIFLFASNFAPTGYAFCAGQLLAISSNTALFSLMGTTYGGNGISTFGLPDLRGRAPIGQGQGPGLNPYVLGQQGGNENITILTSNLPSHNHSIAVSSAAGTTGVPGTTTYLAKGPSTGSGPNATVEKTYSTTAPDTTLSPSAVGITGSNVPISVLSPYLAVSYIVALVGIFPSRN